MWHATRAEVSARRACIIVVSQPLSTEAIFAKMYPTLLAAMLPSLGGCKAYGTKLTGSRDNARLMQASIAELEMIFTLQRFEIVVVTCKPSSQLKVGYTLLVRPHDVLIDTCNCYRGYSADISAFQ